eukprot:GHVL01042297.1.p1 GENE.GHVL01042297.1~~GHVL01042297.1.p1  ORF type:complete len:363 (-),score=43.62 GHVL01042297.1:3455-4543(-)
MRRRSSTSPERSYFDRLSSYVEEILQRQRAGNSNRTLDKVESCFNLLQPSQLNKNDLMSICYQGIPDECEPLRALYWKIAVGYLSHDRSEWASLLSAKRSLYDKYKEELVKQPSIISHLRESIEKRDEYKGKDAAITTEAVNDHPLNEGRQDSDWHIYFKDIKLLTQINKDLFRTRPEMSFFSQNPYRRVSELPKIPKSEEPEVTDELFHVHSRAVPANVEHANAPVGTARPIIYAALDEVSPGGESVSLSYSRRFEHHVDNDRRQVDADLADYRRGIDAALSEVADIQEPFRHYDVLGRILFIYAKLNPGIMYVQGMNEILAPIYFCFASDPVDRAHAEADSFFCFTCIMQSQRDAFCVMA